MFQFSSIYENMTMHQFINLLDNKGIFEHISSGAVLDLGCGNGDNAFILGARGFTVDALDKNEADIIFLRKCAEKKGLENLNLIAGLIEDFKPESKKYSLVIANNSLPFIVKEEVGRIVADLSNSLVDGGFIWITLFGPSDEWAKNPDKSDSTKGMSFFTQEEGLRLLDSLNLKRYFISTEEGYGKTMKGNLKYWQIQKFLYRKP